MNRFFYLYSNLIMKLIDTHAHLYAEEFNEDLDVVIERSIQNDLSHVLLPNIDVDSIMPLKQIVALSNEKIQFLPMMGLHPCYVKEDWETQLAAIKLALDDKSLNCIAVGEIGLDYHWDLTFKEQQQESFLLQIDWAIEKKLPIAIHCRNAYEDVIKILQEKKHEDLRGVLHCFGGSIEEAQDLIDLGFYLGIGGVLTYKNAGLAEVITQIDTKHLMLETDAPYLAPVPYRGKRNESSYLIEIATKLADIKQTSIEEIAAITTRNASLLFQIV